MTLIRRSAPPSSAAREKGPGGGAFNSGTPMSDLADLQHETLAAIEGAPDEAALEAVRVAALGKKGSISALLSTLGKLSPDERRTQGAVINALKDAVAEALAARRTVLKKAALGAQLARETLDVTLPVRLPGIETGRIHPISQVMDEIVAIFAEMGFSVAEGPDIETDDYNFTKLNFPPGHPAREMHDTFFLEPDANGERKLLRTHTSPVQVRTMLSQRPPIRVICPGRTYRTDFDQTHTPMFHQVEGLVVDESATLANLKWVLEEFCKAFFEVPQVAMRFRPSFFPFTSPSMEVDIQCRRSGGDIRFGEGEDWLEILGCGMVHPNVLSNCGIDPETYQGFAWGMGIDRVAMLKYGIPDLRDFFDADLRWINHYGFKPLDMPTLAGGLSG
jgi:phenylalanyl-tRNA synthetase alpha chain